MKEPDKNSAQSRATESGNTADALRERRVVSESLSDDAADALHQNRSRRSFLVAASAAVVSGLGLRWLLSPTGRGAIDRIGRFNEKVGRNIFRSHTLAPEFPRNQAMVPRVNGTEGLSEGFDPALWKLQVVGVDNAQNFPQFANGLSYADSGDGASAQKFPDASVPGLLLTLQDIKALPRTEMTTELKCIEGWSVVVNWAGVRVSDFVAKFPLIKAGNSSQNSFDRAATDLPPYVSLVTPDRGYYVGWDTPSIMHPQTLLCYEMNGEPLSLSHGGPLRLVTTAKYGIKQIKRIGRITFTDRRPPDYWAEQGYDWYSGL